MKHIIYSALVASILVACGQAEKQIEEQLADESAQVSVIDPIKNVVNTKKRFSVSADHADTIKLENGGSIVFQANSFVFENGKPVKGKVDIHWQEFHSLGDIALSGIPMKYDSSGVSYDFSSGGMFTISASQNKKKVEIAEGKKAQVNVVSLEDTPCYNFYELDTTTGDWAYETTQNGVVASDNPDQKTTSDPKNAILHVELMTDNIPELQGKDIIGWKADRPLTTEEENMLSKQFSKSRLSYGDKEGVYKAEIVVKKKTYTFNVTPYLMADAIRDSKQNDKELTADLNALLKYAADVASGKVVRSIEIDNFGTYNWDIVNKRENSQRMIATFLFRDDIDKRMISLYLISPEENIIVKYDAGGDKKFSFDPNKKNCLIAIMPNNELASFSDKDFDRVRKSTPGTEFFFKMKPTGIKLRSSKDIMNHMDELI